MTVPRGKRRPTARQLEIAELLSRPGATQARVAEDLGISEDTVKNHLQALYARLGVRTLAQALRALRRRTPVH